MRNMKNLVQALAMAGIAMAASTAHAELMTTATFSIGTSATATVSDNEGGLATDLNGASLGSATVSQFNSNTGVLTGATLNLTAKQTQSTQVTSSNGTNSDNTDVISSGTGSSEVQISTAGLSQSFGTLTQSDTCGAKAKNSCTGSPTTTTQDTNLVNVNISTASLNAYVGSGSSTLTFSAPTLTASQTDNVFSGTEKTTSTVTWTGSGSIVYDYLLHAAGSFSGTGAQNTLTLDFGQVYQNTVGTTLNFSVFNLAAANRTALDLDSVSGTGNTSVLTTNFSSASKLAQGDSLGFQAFLDTSNFGDFNAVYTINLSDADVGASSTWKASTLTLNLKGSVVPEPLSTALLGIGMLGIAAIRRRK